MKKALPLFSVGIGLMMLGALWLLPTYAHGVLQIDPTAQQQTIDAFVQQQFAATAIIQTQTAEPFQARTATASFDATLRAAFAQAQQATLQASLPTNTFTGVAENAAWNPYIREFDGVPMALVPAGCFTMGNDGGVREERPANQQCFETPFWIDVYEVSQGQFRQFGGEAASNRFFRGDALPVERITWLEARDYCENKRADAMRLPTEAEWEYAARGVDGLTYPWGNQFVAGNVGYDNNSDRSSAAVGSRPNGVSWVGAFDLSGNVSEWVSSIYDYNRYPYPYQAGDGRENRNNETSQRALRGGSWDAPRPYVTATFRRGAVPQSSSNDLGFRCVRSFTDS